MAEPDPAAAFDRCIELSTIRAAGARPQSYAALKIQPKPRPVFLPNLFREIASVDAALRNVLRSLVSGKAKWPLFLTGPPGTGKTCAALAVLDHLFPWQQQYTTAADLTSAIMATFGSNEKFNWRKFGPYRCEDDSREDTPSGKSGAALVVLDELGARGKVTDTHYEAVQRLIDLRTGCPLILVSNLSADELAVAYDGRIASRCQAGTVARLGGRDRRML